MSLLNRLEVFEKDNFGIVVFSIRRFPFRLFSRNPDKVFYQPAFPNAKWHELDAGKVDAEFFFSREDAFQAMAYIRSVQDF